MTSSESTLELLLSTQKEVTTLNLLKELPAGNIQLDLDELLHVASGWRNEIKNQQKLVKS